jgi:tRNA threonylcarbamoyladenosine biosynthesis protein TsaE
MEVFTANTPNNLNGAARALINHLESHPVVAFFGGMGVGKTTFIKEICKQLGVDDTVNSPSFAIINEYLDRIGNSIFHFDLYRLKNTEELYDLGCEDYFYSGNICLIEWPEKADSLLPEKRLDVRMEELSDGSRTIQLVVKP